MKAAPEYRGWMAILEPPPNLAAELRASLFDGTGVPFPPLVPFASALVASGNGAPPRTEFEAAVVRARAHAGALRFDTPVWKGRRLALEPDEGTAELLRGLAACFPAATGADECGGLVVGEALAGEDPGETPAGKAPLAFRAFRLSLWRAAAVEAPAAGWLLVQVAGSWIRSLERAGNA